MSVYQIAGRLAERLDGELARVAAFLLLGAPVAHAHRRVADAHAFAAIRHNGARALVAPAAAQMTARARAAAAHEKTGSFETREFGNGLHTVQYYDLYCPLLVIPFHTILMTILASAVHRVPEATFAAARCSFRRTLEAFCLSA